MTEKSKRPRLLTDKAVAALKPDPAGKRRVMLYDRGPDSVLGFAVMVTPLGAKSYVLSTRFPGTGKPARRTIGKVGAISLANARATARRWRQWVAEGKDPAAEEAEARARRARQREDLFEDVARRYIERYVKGPERKRGPMRTADESEYAINRHLIPRWGKLPITSITQGHVRDLCADFERQGIVAHARNVFTITRSLFKWAVDKRDYELARSPCEGLEPGTLIGVVQARKRVLSDDEVRAFWKACESLGYPYGPLFRLILLTGTRKEEMADAKWSELDIEAKTFTVPPERFKMGRVHVVPLSEQALTILRQVPQFAGGDYLFTTTGGRKAVDGFSKAKAKLDGAMQALLGDSPLTRWTVHDLRRTTRTRLSELRVQPLVAEAVLGHSLPGLLGVYDQWGYMDEKRDALQRWADHLFKIVGSRPSEQSNIIPLRGVS